MVSVQAEEELGRAQKVFEEINVDLQDELPQLWNRWEFSTLSLMLPGWHNLLPSVFLKSHPLTTTVITLSLPHVITDSQTHTHTQSVASHHVNTFSLSSLLFSLVVLASMLTHSRVWLDISRGSTKTWERWEGELGAHRQYTGLIDKYMSRLINWLPPIFLFAAEPGPEWCHDQTGWAEAGQVSETWHDTNVLRIPVDYCTHDSVHLWRTCLLCPTVICTCTIYLCLVHLLGTLW